MKPVLRYTLLGSVLYLLFLIALFPAAQAYRLAADPLKAALPQLQLAGVEGTIWSGKVKSLVYRKAPIGEVSWQLSPLPLMFASAHLNALMQSKDGYLQSQISAPLTGGDGSVELTEIEGRMPITELMRFTPYLPVALDGMLSFDLPGMVVAADGRLIQAEGTVTWHQAAMSAPQALSFGDLQVVLHTDEEGQISGDISDRGGPLKVAGKLVLSPDRSYRLQATVTAAPEAPSSLVSSLGWLGRPDANGRYSINYNGKM